MRKAFIIIGLLLSVLAVVLAVLHFYSLAIVPAVIAFVLGLLAFLKSKKEGQSKHSVQLIFLLTIIALAMATYQSIFGTNELGDTQQLEQIDENSLEDSLEELDTIDLSDDLDTEDLELDGELELSE